jgi:hypothetical protein
MNFNTVVSLPAAADFSAVENASVKFTSAGVELAGASDRVIGTVIRAAAQPFVVGKACDVFLRGNGFHYVRVGDNVQIAVGDTLAQGTVAGTYVKSSTNVAAIAVEAAPANSLGGQIRAILL